MGTRVETIADEDQEAGDYSYNFSANSNGHPPGLYYLRCTVSCGAEQITETMTIVRQ